jgi:putative DNA primase/helicase
MTEIEPPDNVVNLEQRRSAEQAAKDLAPVLSEDHIALEFVRRHINDVRFDWTAQEWHIWSGNRWRRDKTRVASAWTRSLVSALASDQSGPDRKRLGTRKFADGVEGFARTDQRIAVTHEHWDNDIDLVAAPNCYIDLRTGEQFDPEPELFITRAVAVDPANATLCRRWMQLLNEITGNDPTLKRFLQQWSGYSLTGDTSEQKLVFIHGPGGTGKSTFANTVQRIMHEYATTAAMETFTNSRFDRHPEELASLDGMRLVVANETEAGHQWRENRIKTLTGGDAIRARLMRQNSYTHDPRYKLLFVGNHAPAIANLDSAIRRRFVVVPFVRKPAEIDPRLDEALAQEYPGILRWMIEGAVDWHTHRLILPNAVTEATNRYFDEQNIFGQWLEECCVVDQQNRNIMERTADLFTSWSVFAKHHGEEPGAQRDFNQKLRNQGFEPEQIKALSTKGCRGIRLKTTSNWQSI